MTGAGGGVEAAEVEEGVADGRGGGNGYFWVHDRVTGEILAGTPNVAPDIASDYLWTTFDIKTGKPVIYDPNLEVQDYAGHNVTRDRFSEAFCMA